MFPHVRAAGAAVLESSPARKRQLSVPKLRSGGLEQVQRAGLIVASGITASTVGAAGAHPL
jgi:hypothetical protein